MLRNIERTKDVSSNNKEFSNQYLRNIVKATEEILVT
jgi:hypothetical protein